jgi:hypothetical protein
MMRDRKFVSEALTFAAPLEPDSIPNRFRTPNCALAAILSSISNRHKKKVEIALTHSKQRMATRSNRHKFDPGMDDFQPGFTIPQLTPATLGRQA